MSWDKDVLSQFPQLKRQVHGRRLVYLDSGATTLKPLPVIAAVTECMSHGVANVHRGAHFLSDEATGKMEEAREAVRKFVGADSHDEIVFTKGTTDGLNLLARSLAPLVIQEGDEIILSQMEHHSNIVPWHMIAQELKAKVRFAPVQEDGSLDLKAFKAMLSPKVKIVSLVVLSNALGTINPLSDFFAASKAVGAVCVADAAQSVSLLQTDVKSLGCDFLVFSGHKLFAPTGVGVLYGKKGWLEKMPPYQGGGSMISTVTESHIDYLPPAHRFEAGTPAIAEIIGLGAAIKFVMDIGFSRIQKHEREVVGAAEIGLNKIADVRQIGTAKNRGHLVSFLLKGTHPSDVGAILDQQGIAIRAGHHCCQPLMTRFGIPGTARASFSIYSTEADVDDFLKGVQKAQEILL